MGQWKRPKRVYNITLVIQISNKTQFGNTDRSHIYLFICNSLQLRHRDLENEEG